MNGREQAERVGTAASGCRPSVLCNYIEALQGTVSAAAVRAQLRETASRIDFELVPPDDYDELCEGIDEVGRLGDLGKPTIDIDLRISPDALVEIFSEPSTERLRTRARDAYSRDTSRGNRHVEAMKWWYFANLVIIFGLVVVGGTFAKMNRGIRQQNLKAVGITLVAVLASLLALWGNGALDSALGILGAIAGYLFGKARSSDDAESPTVENDAPSTPS